MRVIWWNHILTLQASSCSQTDLFRVSWGFRCSLVVNKLFNLLNTKRQIRIVLQACECRSKVCLQIEVGCYRIFLKS